MIYIDEHKLWFPDNEPRPDKIMSALNKYGNDLNFLLEALPAKLKKRDCIQAGGHLGVWPLKLAPHFGRVVTFEPDPLCFKALERNVAATPNITAFEAALGLEDCHRMLSYYSGRTAVATMSEVQQEGDLVAEVKVMAIDNMPLVPGAIVLDIEGYEPWALRGGRETIREYKPYIVCEMLKKSTEEITNTLAEMGYFPVDNPLNRKCRDTLFTFGGKL